MVKSLQQFRSEQKLRRRLYLFVSFIFIVLVLFTSRLVFLQLVNGYENKVLAKKFVSHQEFTVAPRGLFFDRNFQLGEKPLVQNLRFIDFIIHPDQFQSRKDAMEYVKVFSSVMGRKYEDYAHYFTPHRWRKILKKNKVITLLTRMTRREHERLSAFHIPIQRGEYVTQNLRYYTMGQAMAHVSGFVGLPSAKQLRKKLAQSYQIIGKDGIEARYDSRLRGRDGVRVRHRIVDHEEQIQTTEKGDNLVLTIDRKIQAVAYRTLIAGSRRGAVVVLKPATGEVLALASHPSYDPNILSSGSVDKRKKHLKDVYNHRGFLNIATQAKFPPASAFKPLVALAALENNKNINRTFTFETKYYCPGSFVLKSSLAGRPDIRFNCTGVHGHLNMMQAIQYSCNVYFYNLGYHLGPSSIIEFAKDFGLNNKTGIDLLGEIDSFVPDQRWKQRNYSSRWYDGDTINLSIGQGFLQTTPIALAVLYGAFINRGKIYRPYLVKEIRDSIDHHIIKEFKPTLLREIPLSKKNIDLIQDSLRKGVSHGTSRRISYLPLPIGGKTGTAQTRSKKKGKEHAWFASFAPYGGDLEDTIVVVVFVEYGLAGSLSAVPIAEEIYKVAFPDWTKKQTLHLLEIRKNKKILNL